VTGGGELRGPEDDGDIVAAVKPGGMVGLEGMGSERKTEGKATRLKANFLKSAAAGVVSNRQIFWLPRKDSRKVA
jgi:hypothetical protein